jgi:hypothetical protein
MGAISGALSGAAGGLGFGLGVSDTLSQIKQRNNPVFPGTPIK